MDNTKFTTTAREYFLEWSRSNPDLSLGIGAIQTMDHILQQLNLVSLGQLVTSTLPELTTTLVHCFPGSLSVENACKIYSSVVTRGDTEGLLDVTPIIRSNSRNIVQSVLQSHTNIHKLVNTFLRDGQIILIHSYSHVVTSALINAASQGKRFRVIITESRPECEGYVLAAKLKQHNIPVTMIVDSMAAHVLATVDLILVGAEAVVENGGILNKVGTYQLGIVAKALNKPMYVLTESFKFCRQFIFHQQDIEDNVTSVIRSRIALSTSNLLPQSSLSTIQSISPSSQQQHLSIESTLSPSQGLTEPLPNNNSNNNNNNNNNNPASSLTSPTQSLTPTTSSSPSSTQCTQPHTQNIHHVPLVIKGAICNEFVDADEYLDHKWDYTPPEYITLIFSDIGILSPSAVSDELFKLSY